MNSVGDSVALIWPPEDRAGPAEMKLGKLVQFQKRRGGPKAVPPVRGGKADILIFTGVRYEREATDAPTKPSASPRAKRKRG